MKKIPESELDPDQVSVTPSSKRNKVSLKNVTPIIPCSSPLDNEEEVLEENLNKDVGVVRVEDAVQVKENVPYVNDLDLKVILDNLNVRHLDVKEMAAIAGCSEQALKAVILDGGTHENSRYRWFALDLARISSARITRRVAELEEKSRVDRETKVITRKYSINSDGTRTLIGQIETTETSPPDPRLLIRLVDLDHRKVEKPIVLVPIQPKSADSKQLSQMSDEELAENVNNLLK